MELEFKPIADRVLILPDQKKEKTDGGIIIPDSVEQTAFQGTVIDAGELSTLKAGDRIIYNSNACGKVELGSVWYDIARDIIDGPIDMIIN